MQSQAKVRIVIYALIAFLTTTADNLKELSPEALSGMIWTDWTVMVITPALASLVAIRAFLDQSLSRDYKNTKKLEDLKV